MDNNKIINEINDYLKENTNRHIIECIYNIIKFNRLGKSFSNICIINDSEIGKHIYINNYEKDITFDTDDENIIYIINEIIKRIGFYE